MNAYFTDVETEAQGSYGTHPRLLSYKWRSWDSNPGQPGQKLLLLSSPPSDTLPTPAIAVLGAPPDATSLNLPGLSCPDSDSGTSKARRE